MQAFAIFLGMSLSFAGVGGLLSGIFSKSLKRALLWASGFGLLEIILLLIVSPIGRFAPAFLIISLFWGAFGWFTLGRIFSRRRATKKENAS